MTPLPQSCVFRLRFGNTLGGSDSEARIGLNSYKFSRKNHLCGLFFLLRRTLPLLAVASVFCVSSLCADRAGAARPDARSRCPNDQLFARGPIWAGAGRLHKCAESAAPDDDRTARTGLILSLSRLDRVAAGARRLCRKKPPPSRPTMPRDAWSATPLSLLRAGQPVGAGAREPTRAPRPRSSKNYWGHWSRGDAWNSGTGRRRRRARRCKPCRAACGPDAPDAWFYLVDAFEDDVTDELLKDVDTYLALSNPKAIRTRPGDGSPAPPCELI